MYKQELTQQIKRTMFYMDYSLEEITNRQCEETRHKLTIERMQKLEKAILMQAKYIEELESKLENQQMSNKYNLGVIHA